MTHGLVNEARRPATQIERMFVYGMAFHEAAQAVNARMEKTGRVHLGQPYAVLSAFALELLLKNLIRIEGGTPPGIHNLKKLFDCLSAESQHAIRTAAAPGIARKVAPEYAAILKLVGVDPVPSIDFDFCLSASAEAFDKLRYLHEAAEDESRGFDVPREIVDATADRVLELHPEFRTLGGYTRQLSIPNSERPTP